MDIRCLRFPKQDFVPSQRTIENGLCSKIKVVYPLGFGSYRHLQEIRLSLNMQLYNLAYHLRQIP